MRNTSGSLRTAGAYRNDASFSTCVTALVRSRELSTGFGKVSYIFLDEGYLEVSFHMCFMSGLNAPEDASDLFPVELGSFDADIM